MKTENTLHLTLKKKWFDMILKGEKKEEYREIKPYWERRFTSSYEFNNLKDKSTIYKEMAVARFNDFNQIQFRNGYAKNAPTMTVECKGISIGTSKSEWCDDGEKKVYVIKLGNVLFHKNCI